MYGSKALVLLACISLPTLAAPIPAALAERSVKAFEQEVSGRDPGIIPTLPQAPTNVRPNPSWRRSGEVVARNIVHPIDESLDFDFEPDVIKRQDVEGDGGDEQFTGSGKRDVVEDDGGDEYLNGPSKRDVVEDDGGDEYLNDVVEDDGGDEYLNGPSKRDVVEDDGGDEYLNGPSKRDVVEDDGGDEYLNGPSK
ncbi:hypothetical protein BDV96DRAFT_606373 [Lophiotrema nucula]|uniref:Uncharacterized protein n=1 Tax=Lophiotrema nucula TaxID=690887 RepID=A0A6A5YMR7_9PLEO|nr:hypothetical protein BDV96DRAFT_606373 [Lophiotrema nucula]